MKIELEFQHPFAVQPPLLPTSRKLPQLENQNQRRKSPHRVNPAPEFSVRVAPLPGESITSFICRLLESNGLSYAEWMRMLGVPSVAPDWDCNITDFQLSSLSLASGLSVETLTQMSMRPEANQIAASDMKTGIRQHLLSSHHGKRGSQYCPDCLREDRTPYLRKHWRYSYVVACATHRRVLVEDCPNCGENFRPFARSREYDNCTITRCRACKQSVISDLTPPADRELADRVLILQAEILSAIEDGWTHLRGNYDLHCIPYVAGIRLLLRFATSPNFLHTAAPHLDFFGKKTLYAEHLARSNRLIRSNESSEQPLDQRVIWEHLSSKTRAIAMSLVSTWLRNWPVGAGTLVGTNLACREYWQVLRKRKLIPHWIETAFDHEYLGNLVHGIRFETRFAKEKLMEDGYFNLQPKEVRRFMYTGIPPLEKKDPIQQVLLTIRARKKAYFLTRRQNQSTTIERLRNQLHDTDTRLRNEALKRDLKAQLIDQIRARMWTFVNGRNEEHLQRLDQVLKSQKLELIDDEILAALLQPKAMPRRR